MVMRIRVNFFGALKVDVLFLYHNVFEKIIKQRKGQNFEIKNIFSIDGGDYFHE